MRIRTGWLRYSAATITLRASLDAVSPANDSENLHIYLHDVGAFPAEAVSAWRIGVETVTAR